MPSKWILEEDTHTNPSPFYIRRQLMWIYLSSSRDFNVQIFLPGRIGYTLHDAAILPFWFRNGLFQGKTKQRIPRYSHKKSSAGGLFLILYHVKNGVFGACRIRKQIPATGGGFYKITAPLAAFWEQMEWSSVRGGCSRWPQVLPTVRDYRWLEQVFWHKGFELYWYLSVSMTSFFVVFFSFVVFSPPPPSIASYL